MQGRAGQGRGGEGRGGQGRAGQGRGGGARPVCLLVLTILATGLTKLSFASVRVQAAERSHNFVVDLSSDVPNHQRGVAMSITVTMSAVQSHTPDVMQTRCGTVVQSPFTVVEVDLSVGDDHRCCPKPHGSLHSFSLTGSIF